MKSTFATAVAGLAFALLAAIPARADQIIDLRSGNGSVGGTDSAVSYLLGPADSAFGSPFVAQDFTDARNGSAASIVNPNGAWLTPAAFAPDTTARWISNSSTGASIEGASALYAIDFTVTDWAVAAASITFNFSVDNQLGSGVNEGLFLNGTALSGSTTGGNFNAVYTFTRSDIASLLVNGTNTLYINTTDVGGPAGLIFSATISTVAVPEPGMVALLGLGLAGLGLARRRSPAA